MLKVALTGGIATGKTHALRRLRQLEVPTIDADDLVHGALRAGTPASLAIAQHFGAEVLGPDGAVDRKALGIRVFRDPEARHALEGILHPQVYRAIQAWFDELTASGAPLGVADIPLLFETQHESDFDVVVVTACAPLEQIRRVMRRDGASEPEAKQRVDAQMPIEEKVKRADFVVWTDGTLDETDRQVRAVYAALVAQAGTG